MARHVVIVGNGIAGITAARFVRKLRADRITVVADETDHFYARTALMYLYMGHMRYQDVKPYEDGFWERNGIELLRGVATHIDTAKKRLQVHDGRVLRYDALLLATGSRSNKFGWPGQDLDGVQGLYGIPDLITMERWTRDIDRAVVVGGGLIGIEMTEMLHSRHVPVTFLVREPRYMDYLLPQAESDIIHAEIRRHDIDLRLQTELKAILGAERCEAVTTTESEVIPCQFTGLAVGVHPNTDLARASDIRTGRGIVVDEYFRTSAPDVYAAGDCAEFIRDGIGARRIEQLWYTGRQHGRCVARNICGLPTAYDKGVFFNSAKFFTIEYQTYGDIRPKPPDGVRTIAWKDGRRRKLLRIDYEEESGIVRGFNALGTRLRHDVCEHWILSGATVAQVVREWDRAHFDAEFAPRHRRALARALKQSPVAYA